MGLDIGVIFLYFLNNQSSNYVINLDYFLLLAMVPQYFDLDSENFLNIQDFIEIYHILKDKIQ